MGSFVEFCRQIFGMLEFAGATSGLGNLDRLRAQQDDEHIEMERVLRGLACPAWRLGRKQPRPGCDLPGRQPPGLVRAIFVSCGHSVSGITAAGPRTDHGQGTLRVQSQARLRAAGSLRPNLWQDTAGPRRCCRFKPRQQCPVAGRAGGPIACAHIPAREQRQNITSITSNQPRPNSK
jgi:hypothetical protein